jgi:general secretion pathway protein K
MKKILHHNTGGTCSIQELANNDRGGVALVLVLWIIVVLTAIVGEFSFSMRTDLNATKNFKEEEESYQAALAGIELAKLEILTVKEPFYVYKSETDTLVFGEDNEEPDRTGELDNSLYSYIINDEDGKLNINNATQQQMKKVISNSGVEITEVDTIVDSIVDWRDSNDLHMLNGAEEDYYRTLEPPYSCKDGPFDIIEELLLIKGVTPEIFYGSEEGDDIDEKKYSGIANLLSPWSPSRVNVNTSSREVLEAVLGVAEADRIINQLESGPILSPPRKGIITSSIFTVISTISTKYCTIKRTIKTTLRKSGNTLEVLFWNDNFIG